MSVPVEVYQQRDIGIADAAHISDLTIVLSGDRVDQVRHATRSESLDAMLQLPCDQNLRRLPFGQLRVSVVHNRCVLVPILVEEAFVFVSE